MLRRRCRIERASWPPASSSSTPGVISSFPHARRVFVSESIFEELDFNGCHSAGHHTSILFRTSLQTLSFTAGTLAAQESGQQRSAWRLVGVLFQISLSIVKSHCRNAALAAQERATAHRLADALKLQSKNLGE